MVEITATNPQRRDARPMIATSSRKSLKHSATSYNGMAIPEFDRAALLENFVAVIRFAPSSTWFMKTYFRVSDVAASTLVNQGPISSCLCLKFTEPKLMTPCVSCHISCSPHFLTSKSRLTVAHLSTEIRQCGLRFVGAADGVADGIPLQNMSRSFEPPSETSLHGAFCSFSVSTATIIN